MNVDIEKALAQLETERKSWITRAEELLENGERERAQRSEGKTDGLAIAQNILRRLADSSS